MNKDSKIFVAGHRGLVGSAILKNLKAKGYTNFVLRTHAELDLTDQQAVHDFFAAEKPEYVFLAAAHVGGIVANSRYRANFCFWEVLVFIREMLRSRCRRIACSLRHSNIRMNPTR